MLSSDVFVRKALSFFSRISKHALAFVAQWKIDRRRNLLPDGRVSFDLFADRLNRSVRTEEAIGQGLVFSKESQQQVFSLDIRRTELAGFVPRKKDDAPCLFCVTLKHKAPELLRGRKAHRPAPQKPDPG